MQGLGDLPRVHVVDGFVLEVRLVDVDPDLVYYIHCIACSTKFVLHYLFYIVSHGIPAAARPSSRWLAFARARGARCIVVISIAIIIIIIILSIILITTIIYIKLINIIIIIIIIIIIPLLKRVRLDLHEAPLQTGGKRIVKREAS